MPELDGMDAVRLFRVFEAKEQAGGRRAKRQLIIGMSANCDADTIQEAVGAQFIQFFDIVHVYVYFSDYPPLCCDLRERHGLVLR